MAQRAASSDLDRRANHARWIERPVGASIMIVLGLAASPAPAWLIFANVLRT